MPTKEFLLNPYKDLDNESGWLISADHSETRTLQGGLELLRFQARDVLFTRHTIEKRKHQKAEILETRVTVVLGYRASKEYYNRVGKEVIDVEPISAKYHEAIRALLPVECQKEVSFW